MNKRMWFAGWILAPVTALSAVLGNPSGTGGLPAVAQSVDDLPGHTLFAPAKLPRDPLPLFVWGNGGCRDNGLAHGAFLRQIASNGYIVIALGKPREERPFEPATAPAVAPPLVRPVAPGTPDAPPRTTPDETQVAQMLEAIDWATRENARQGSALAGHIDLAKIAAGGHSCGGLQALAVSDDPRVKTTLVLNSGIYVRRDGARSGVNIDKSQLAKLHGPMLYLAGGPSDIAHPNASDDVARIGHVPVFFGELPVGHGGTFWSERDGGSWARVAARWLDWTLKGDADASWDFSGPACRLCSEPRWTVVQKNLPAPTGPFRQSMYVPVRDGTLLAMNVYRPARAGVPVATRSPVVFSFTPYRARFRDANGRVTELGNMSRDVSRALFDAGYVVAVADVRGKGASFGTRRGFQDRTEANDGHDLVQWLATQPWADGKVGMYGCSYLGGTTVHVASTAPPALRAIFTGATDLDKYAFVRNGGITAQFNTRPDEPLTDDLASVPLDADRDGALLKMAVAQHGLNTPMGALWYGMPFRDSISTLTGNRFWEEAGPYPYLDTLRRAGIATYYWGNFEDEPTAQVVLAAENLGSRLLLGPGTHCVPPPGMDFAGEVKGYFDSTLKGVQPATPPARVKWWLDEGNGRGSWHQDQRWPGVKAAMQRMYLAPQASAGAGNLTLQSQPARSSRPGFRVNYDVGSAEYFAFWITSQHGKGLSFATPPLDEAQQLVGFPVVHLRVASDRPEPLLFAYLEQVNADGSTVVLAFGRQAAALRKTGSAPYDTLGLPWMTGLEADFAPLSPGRAVEVDFPLTAVSRVIPAGSRLRLVVTGADPRQRNLAQLKLDPPPSITVETGGKGGSWLELPLQRSTAVMQALAQGEAAR
ncbi:MAG: CocE/NonD family hydrolase [Proteobacteria bacterium]|nr:CocE/NonD family hydrolase [Pseudomonadota bacterium]